MWQSMTSSNRLMAVCLSLTRLWSSPLLCVVQTDNEVNQQEIIKISSCSLRTKKNIRFICRLFNDDASCSNYITLSGMISHKYEFERILFRLSTAASWVRSQSRPCGICGRQSTSGSPANSHGTNCSTVISDAVIRGYTSVISVARYSIWLPFISTQFSTLRRTEARTLSKTPGFTRISRQ
jgi:hypothetical protein